MKIFLNNFTLYSDMETHLQKFRLCFQKCWEYNINLNPKKILWYFMGYFLDLLYQKKVSYLIQRKYR